MLISAWLFSSQTHLLVLTNDFSSHIDYIKNIDSHNCPFTVLLPQIYGETFRVFTFTTVVALLMQYSHSSFLTMLLLWTFSGCLLLLKILNWNDLILANKVFLSSFKVEQLTFIFSKNLLTSAGNWTYFDSYLETCVFSVTTHWFFAPGNPLCFFLDLDVSRWSDILTILWNTILATENIGKLH